MIQKRLLSGWENFWMRPAHPEPLALCRIVFYAGLLWLYAAEDFRIVTDLAPLRWRPISFITFLAPSAPPTADVILWMQTIWKISLFASMAGFMTRVSTLLACLLGLYLVALPFCVVSPTHEMGACGIGFIVLALSRCGDALSLDSLISSWGRRPGRNPVSPEYGWPIQLMRTVICLVFFGAGVSKLQQSGLAWILSDNLQLQLGARSMPAAAWLISSPQLCRFLAGSTIFIEALHPLALFSRMLACIFVPGAILLLISIWIFMDIRFVSLMLAHVFWLPWFVYPGSKQVS
jgi:hypothetical protein